jgi:hypothetical protein
MAQRKKVLFHNFRYDPRDMRRLFKVKCSPATRKVELKRSDIDVLTSRRGTSVGCTNSNCAVRMGRAAFGHDVFLADFTKTSVYIVDKLDKNGQPKHCIWYKHNDGATIDMNDHVVNRKDLLRSLDMGKTVVLRPPRTRIGRVIAKSHSHTPSAESRTQETERRKPVAYGAMRRAVEAGLLVLQS